MTLGERIRFLRYCRGIACDGLGTSRAHLSRIESDRQCPSIGLLLRLCSLFEVGVSVLLESEERFFSTLALQDDFVVIGVLPFLKRLTEEQKELIVRTLEAAPKISMDRRHHLEPTESLILNAYRRSTGGKTSTTTSRTSTTRSSPSVR